MASEKANQLLEVLQGARHFAAKCLAPCSRRGFVIIMLMSVAVPVFFMYCAYQELRGSTWLQFFRLMELKSLDMRFRIRGPVKASNDLAIVAIDEETIEREKSYPLPRGRYAQLVDRLVDAGAKVIVFDILFVEPQNKDQLDRIDKAAVDYRKAHPSASKDDPVLALLNEQRQAFDEDAKLAAAFRRALEKSVFVVTGIHFISAAEAKAESLPERKLSGESYRILVGSAYPVRHPIKPKEEPEYKEFKIFPRQAVAALDVIYPLAEASAGMGFVDHALDDDGVLRSEFLVTEYKDEYYACLGVHGLFWFLNLEQKDFVVNFWKSIHLGQIVVPTEQDSRMLINFRGAGGTFPTYSLSRVISGAVDPGTFKGKMVLVGATAKGVGDFYVTPFTARLPGVEKHANVADCILKKDFILRDWRVALRDQIIVLCVGLITGLLLAFLTASMGLCAVVVLWGLMAWYCYSQFAYHGVWHNMTYPSLTIFLTFCLVLAYRFGTEARRRREVKRVFEQYMQASVVTDLLRRADEVKLGGDVREVTVFFSDLAGFSTISETLTPQGVIAFLNECYDQMAPAILERNAFLDKFWGDAIVAAFGVPMGDKDHAIQACLAALDCQGRLDQLNERLAAQGKPQAKARIGLHSGPAVVGNVGSHVAKRFNYTALGDAVNLGARLESANKDFQTSILMSQSTYSLAKYVVEARELGKIVVKGRKEPVPVYELLGEINRVPGHRLVLADIFRHGLNLYMKRDWDGAIFAFQKALAHSPKDGPALLYLRACKVLKANPPPENWDGILVMKEGKD